MRKKMNITASDLMPFIIVIIMVVIFGIATGGSVFEPSNLKNLFNQSVATLIAGLGMIFVASMGATDITHGSLLALATVFGFLAANQLGFLFFLPVTILVGLLSGLLLGVINAKLKVPSFMASLALLIAYRAFVNLILSSASYSFPSELGFFNDFWFDVAAVIILIVIIAFIFHYTPFGVYVKAIGENENAVLYAGINVTKIKILAFVLSGAMAAIAGIFMIARVGGTNNTIGSGFEMKVMMAMFIGGVPVEGGMKSKLYKLIIGAPTIILLENGLVLCGVDGSATQLIRGIVLLAAIYATMQVNEKFKYGFNYKKKEIQTEAAK